jgi:uncharacterized Fe-S cluster protein YjdI
MRIFGKLNVCACLILCCLNAFGKLGHAENCIRGNGFEMSEERHFTAFDTIDIAGAYNVSINYGSEQRFKITGDDNILPHIITRVKQGTLFIYTNRPICTANDITIKINTSLLKSLIAAGAGDIEMIDVQNRSLSVRTAGAIDMRLAGRTDSLDVVLAGAGDFVAQKLKTENARISVTGAGDAILYASESLTVQLDGAGDLTCYGNPAKVSKKISGVGDILIK